MQQPNVPAEQNPVPARCHTVWGRADGFGTASTKTSDSVTEVLPGPAAS